MTEQNVSIVTGGAGFIGSHLCDALLALGHTVTCVDNLITGSEQNLQQAKKNSRFTFIRHDVSVSFNNETMKQFSNVNFIFHLASPASVLDYQKYPIETAVVNSVGTMHMLELAKTVGARFLYTSTSEIYGDPKEHPQKESYWGNVNSIGPRACYDESKRFGEMITSEYVKQKNLDGRVARIFNTYGPRMRKTDGRVVSNFIHQALAGEPLTVYGTGKQTRSFSYVDDLVSGILSLMFTDNLNGVVINLGNPEEYTVLKLANKIKRKTGTKSEITFKPLPGDDPKRRRPDISKAKKLLGWEPKITIDEGLNKTIAYYISIS